MRWLGLSIVLGFGVACGPRERSVPPSERAPEVVAAAPLDAAGGHDADAAGADDPELAMSLDLTAPPPPPPARELGVPARTVCQVPCRFSEPTDPRVCVRYGAGAVAVGVTSHLSCHIESVQLDCCAPLPADRPGRVMRAMGWDAGTPAQRTAIAWTIERLVFATAILGLAPDGWPPGVAFAAPTATTADGDVVLDFWAVPPTRRTSFVHRRVTYAADTTRTATDLTSVAPLDPAPP